MQECQRRTCCHKSGPCCFCHNCAFRNDSLALPRYTFGAPTNKDIMKVSKILGLNGLSCGMTLFKVTV